MAEGHAGALPRRFCTATAWGPIEHGALHKPVHGSVAYGFDTAEMLAAVFQGTEKGFSYSRSGNPTVEALEAKITAMEGGVGTVAFRHGHGRHWLDPLFPIAPG